MVVSAITLNIPDELAQRLRNEHASLPEILEMGLRDWHATREPGSFQGAAEVLEFLASLPSPEDILALRPSEALTGRVRTLIAKSREGTLDPKEEAEWERYEFVEHLVRIAKMSASEKLGLRPKPDA